MTTIKGWFSAKTALTIAVVPIVWHLSHGLWGYALLHALHDLFRLTFVWALWIVMVLTLLYEFVYERFIGRTSPDSFNRDHVADVVQRLWFAIPATVLNSVPLIHHPVTWGWVAFGVMTVLYIVTLRWSVP